jgi:hypothetical protein
LNFEKEKVYENAMSLFLVLSWISVAAVEAAQPQAPGADISARVFNSTDITVPQLKPGEWTSLTFNSERWDTANLHETATNSGRLKAPWQANTTSLQHHMGNPHRHRTLGTAPAVEWKDCHC